MPSSNEKNHLGRNLLFADAPVGFEITKFLLDDYNDDICGVVTVSQNEIYDLAKKKGKDVFVFEKGLPFINRLPENINWGLLAWWPFIVKPPLLGVPSQGFLNTHASFLPHNRGKNPNFWSIVEARPFGVTLHKIDDGVDTGPIVSQKEIGYDWTDTGGTLYQRGLVEMVELFKLTYPKISEGNTRVLKQEQNGSFHVSTELKPASQIHLDETYLARDLLNLLRARTFSPHPACYFNEGSETFEVRVSITKKTLNE